MPLFEVAIMEKPTEEERKNGKVERLVLGPKTVVAADPQGAAIGVVLDDPIPLTGVDRSRMEVLVRPFV